MVPNTDERGAVHMPPGFDQAVTLRQKACAAGPNPNFWYPVEWDSRLRVGKVLGAKLWDTPVAIYRTRDRKIYAIEDRCAHRHVKLSHGLVRDCHLQCIYHGWTYAQDGSLVDIPHDRFGKPFPKVKLRTFPTQVRYGLIWVFFGDATLADEVGIPAVPELECEQPWVCVPLDFIWRAHPTMLINNVMDSTHVATLHNRSIRTRSLIIKELLDCRAEGDRVTVVHRVERDEGALLWYLANDIKEKTQEACFDYPHMWVSVGGVYKLWNFVLPIDRTTTRIFLLSLSEQVKIPFTPWRAPYWLHHLLLPLTRRLVVRPLFDEDGWSARIEQEGYDEQFDQPSVELHPAPRLCYQLTIRKWEEHLASIYSWTGK
jgi:4beta-methylsterol monooxygenase